MKTSRSNSLCAFASSLLSKPARLWAAAATALLLTVSPFATHAQAPEQSVRMVVPYGPGGTSDITARVLQAPLAKALGQNVVVENKAGAAGTVAARYVAGARPDGQTLLIPNSANTLAPLLQEGQPFDYAASFVAVSRVASAPMVMLVSPAIPVTSVAELAAYAKKNPSKVEYGTSGVGSFGQLAVELFQQRAGVRLLAVPYQGGAQAILGLLAGDVKVLVVSLPDARNAIQQNKGVRAIAVTSPERTRLMEGVPAMAETLPDYVVMQHFGLLAPAGTPPDVVKKLADATATALAAPEVREKFVSLGMLPVSSSPAEFAKVMADDRAHWGPIISTLVKK